MKVRVDFCLCKTVTFYWSRHTKCNLKNKLRNIWNNLDYHLFSYFELNVAFSFVVFLIELKMLGM